MWRNHILLRVVSAVLFLTLAQCGFGENSKAAKVKIKTYPESPIVINTDWTYEDADGNTVTVKGPWFAVRLEVENGSDEYVTVQSFSFEGSGITDGGGVKTFKFSIDPGKIDATYLLEIAPGDSDTTDLWYIYGLPDDVVGYAYTIDAKIEGWFGEADTPTNRIDKSKMFMTR